MESLPNYFSGILGILLLTSFVKILTVFSILRIGMGLEGVSFGLVVILAAFALSLVTISPRIEQAGGVNALLSGNIAGIDLMDNFGPFVESRTDPRIMERMEGIAARLHSDEVQGTDAEELQSPNSGVMIAAFIISELKQAFQIGFLILIPFLLIDLIVTNILMILGITQISSSLISFPAKIFAFFVIDGWLLLSEKLLGGGGVL